MIALTLALCLLPAFSGLEPQEPGSTEPTPRAGSARQQVFQGRFQQRSPDGVQQRADQAVTIQEQPARPWIGVEIATEPSDRRGLGLARVVEGSPAARAGLRAGDRLVALEGEELADFDALRARLDGLRPGLRVGLTLLRELRVQLDERGWGDDRGPRLGLSLSEQRTDRGEALIVSGLERGWPAARAGLRAGDRLVRAGDRQLASFDTLQDVLGGVEPGESVGLVVERRVELTLGTFPAEAAAAPDVNDFFFEQPPEGTERDEAPRSPQNRYRLLEIPRTPGGPQASVPFGQPRDAQTSQMQEQMRDLASELRSLREELRALRAELEGLRRQRDR